MGDVGLKRREKVTMACLRCRRRKIKCDGQSPCANCVKSKEPYCNYPDYLTSRREPSNNNTKHYMYRNGQDSEVERRLSRVEALLENLVEKLGMDRKETLDKTAQGTDKLKLGTNAAYLKQKIYNNDSVRVRSCERDEQMSQRMKRPKIRPSAEVYFGTHTTLYIFSEKSLDWIRSKLPQEDQKLLHPIENMSFFCEQFWENFSNTWIDPFNGKPESLNLLRDFFQRGFTLHYNLLDYFEKHNLANYLCDKSQIRKIIENHLNEEKHQRSATSSELLIICVSLSLGISILIDEKLRDQPKNSEEDYLNMRIFEGYSLQEMIVIQEALMNKSIFYFHRILVVSEGIHTIQGILLFIIFLESSWFEDSASYILTSIAVRYAQAMGLHRHDSFYGLPEEEIKTRSKIWRFCQYLDMEICYRFGRPPIINASEVSTFELEKEAADVTFNLNKDSQHSNDESDLLYGKTSEEYNSDLLIRLTEIRAKSYAKLFSSSPDYSNIFEFVSCVDELSDEMFAFSQSIDPRIAPKFYDDPDFGNLDSFFELSEKEHGRWYETLLITHLTYFVHLMTINSVPFHFTDPDRSPLMENNFNLAIGSARTILHTVKRIGGRRTLFSCTNWLIFFPFSAFLMLLCKCINFPSSPDSVNDVNLLVDVSLNFFSKNNRRFFFDKNNIKNFCHLQNFIDILTRIMLSVLIRIMEVKVSWRTNEELRNFLDIENNAYAKPFFEGNMRLFPTNKPHCVRSSSTGSSFNNRERGSSKFRFPSSLWGRKSSGVETSRSSTYEERERLAQELQNDNMILPDEGGLNSYMDDVALDFQIPTKWDSLPNFFFDS